MSQPIRTQSRPVAAANAEPHQEDAPSHKAARLWVHQFARALKTCRLYERTDNPTVERFLAELANALTAFLAEHGSLALRFTAEDVIHEEQSVYVARSREDNLALPFYRDGVRGLAFMPGITRQELEALIATILRVTVVNQTDDDLVTLLWEAQLDHVDIDFVPAEGDVGAGVDLDADEVMPWPEPEESSAVVTVEDDEADTPSNDRSDDWTIRELTTEVEAGFAELERLAPEQKQRFLDEYRREHEVPVTTAAIAIIQAYLAAGADEADPGDLGKFLPRVLREALTIGEWPTAAECVRMLARYGGDQWVKETFIQELMQPISTASFSALLDAQSVEGVLDFIEFTHSLGDGEIDVLVAMLAQSEHRRNRRLLLEAVVRLCRDNPERLAPWLADRRWHIVRNVVHMLGMMGGADVVGMLGSVLRHPEPRVRYAVIAALGQVPPASARSFLMSVLNGGDTRAFCSALQVLSQQRDAALARHLYGLMQEAEFERRPGPERRAVYQALSLTGVDEIVPDLEAEMYRGHWFSAARDEHRQAIARCLARIGTLHSMQALERGAQSRRSSVRKACEEALLGWAPGA